MAVSRKRVQPTTVMDGSHVTSDGGEAEEWLERRDHPLCNDLILKTLFGFVRRYDLTTCRDVCTKWNVRTIPRMRTAFKVTIHGTQSKRRNSEIPEDARTMHHFVKLFSCNQFGIPFAQYQLEPFCTQDGVGHQFLELCGEIATEIDLDEGESNIIYTIEDFSEILRCSPNLKVLGCPSRIISRSRNIVKLFPHSIPSFPSLRKITFRSLYEKERLEFCPTWIEELLTAAPNVSDIAGYDVLDDEDEYEGNSGTSFVLNCIEKLGRESGIESLDLHSARIRHIEHVRRMTEKENGLKLKSLTFEPKSNTEENFDTALIQLANILKDTLQHLTMYEWSNNVNWTQFPYMSDLKSLTIKISNEFEFEIPAVNLNNYFPALQKLCIGFEENEEGWDDFFSVFQFQSCPTVKSLSVEKCHVDIPTFNHFLNVFPNLTRLDFRFEEDGVQILRPIWTSLTQLESLSIDALILRTEYLDLDSFLTGIPTKRLRRLRPVGNELEKMSVQQRKDKILELRSRHCRFPSIIDLTKLRRLNLNVTGEVKRCFYTQTMTERRTYRLTDLTAYLALYSMTHLSDLDVIVCTFTKTCCEILTKETGLESWSFRNGTGKEGHIIPPFYLHDGDNSYD